MNEMVRALAALAVQIAETTIERDEARAEVARLRAEAAKSPAEGTPDA